jgi:hypothetical protein
MRVVERQLSNQQIDLELSKVKFTNDNFAKQFHHQTQQTWFREYGKGSITMLKKITAKVKRGIKHNRYGESGLNVLDDGWKQYIKPQQDRFANKKQRAKSEDFDKTQSQISNGENKKQRAKSEKLYKQPSGKETNVKNPAKVTKREYTKQVKQEAQEFRMPDF